MNRYLRQVWAIAEKDLRVEWRTRERFASMGAFVVLSGVLFNYAIDRTVVHPGQIASALIWMILVLGGLLGLGRTFELEKEEDAMAGLLVAPVPRDALYLGKVLSNTILLSAVVALTVFVVALFFLTDPQSGVDGAAFRANAFPIVLVLGLGTVGFVALGTLFSAISAATRMGSTLLPVLLFPLLVPPVVFGSATTADLLAGFPLAAADGNLRLLGAFALVALGAGTGLFRFIVED